MSIFKSIVVAYFLCLLPYGLYIILLITWDILRTIDKCKFIGVLCFHLLPSLSTAINPLILFTFSTNFRQALHRHCPFLHGKCRSCCRVSMQQEDVSWPELVSFKKTSG